MLQKNPVSETKRSLPHSQHSAKNNENEERVPVLKALRKNKSLVVAVAAYLATSPDQLNLKIGDIIDVGKETATGWSNGFILNCSPRRHGWFPTSYVKTLGSEYALSELSSTSDENLNRDGKAYTEVDDHEDGNLSDQSFDSDDSDYESTTQQVGTLLKRQLWASKMPIAIMSVESIDAVQLYTQNHRKYKIAFNCSKNIFLF